MILGLIWYLIECLFLSGRQDLSIGASNYSCLLRNENELFTLLVVFFYLDDPRTESPLILILLLRIVFEKSVYLVDFMLASGKH